MNSGITPVLRTCQPELQTPFEAGRTSKYQIMEKQAPLAGAKLPSHLVIPINHGDPQFLKIYLFEDYYTESAIITIEILKKIENLGSSLEKPEKKPSSHRKIRFLLW